MKKLELQMLNIFIGDVYPETKAINLIQKCILVSIINFIYISIMFYIFFRKFKSEDWMKSQILIILCVRATTYFNKRKNVFKGFESLIRK